MRTRTKRALDGRGRLTGAVDKDGILIPLTNPEIETLSRDEVLDFQERRRQQIADKEANDRAIDDFERYKERFVAAGGDASDAEAAYQAMKKSQAAQDAGRAEEAALQRSRTRARQAL